MQSSIFLLDTDISSYLIKKRYPVVQERYQQVPTASIYLSTISVAELHLGLQRLPLQHSLHEKVSTFIDEIQIVSWDVSAAQLHAQLKHRLEGDGTMIGEMDLMIAAHAISLGATLVTNNLKHFGRLQPELVINNWVSG
jgi:tRNA(fMet)-specific endonuclease VapC